MRHPPRALEELWYQRLKESGFEDIEDVSRRDRPLKSWQSWQFTEESRSQRRARNEEYQSLIDSFLHREDFPGICEIVAPEIQAEPKRYRGCKPGALPFSAAQVRQAWELHCEGITERQIAARLERSKTGVHKILASLRIWAKLT